MKRHAVRMFRLIAGSILLIVGVIGGFIPVLQGWIFILLGLSIIAPESERARRLLRWARTKARPERLRAAPVATRDTHGKAQIPGARGRRGRRARRARRD